MKWWAPHTNLFTIFASAASNLTVHASRLPAVATPVVPCLSCLPARCTDLTVTCNGRNRLRAGLIISPASRREREPAQPVVCKRGKCWWWTPPWVNALCREQPVKIRQKWEKLQNEHLAGFERASGHSPAPLSLLPSIFHVRFWMTRRAIRQPL